jgi:hypothetical protein
MKVVEGKKQKGQMIIPECPGCGGFHFVNTNPEIKGPLWGFNGDLDKPTFTPSILTIMPIDGNDKRICHSFVRNGQIEFCSDSPHKLAGKTVVLPEIDQESSFYYSWLEGNY